MSEMETGTNKPSFRATFINDRPMRPNPWMAILLMMCLLVSVPGQGTLSPGAGEPGRPSPVAANGGEAGATAGAVNQSLGGTIFGCSGSPSYAGVMIWMPY